MNRKTTSATVVALCLIVATLFSFVPVMAGYIQPASSGPSDPSNPSSQSHEAGPSDVSGQPNASPSLTESQLTDDQLLADISGQSFFADDFGAGISRAGLLPEGDEAIPLADSQAHPEASSAADAALSNPQPTTAVSGVPQPTAQPTAKPTARPTAKPTPKPTAKPAARTTAPANTASVSGRVLLGTFNLTAYCACEKCCGKAPGHPGYGITASGARVQEGVTIAADTRVIPMGSRVYIEGVGERVVQDRGGGVKGNRIDIYFASHQAALQFGRKNRSVYLIK